MAEYKVGDRVSGRELHSKEFRIGEVFSIDNDWIFIQVDLTDYPQNQYCFTTNEDVRLVKQLRGNSHV